MKTYPVSQAVVIQAPRELAWRSVSLTEPGADDVVIRTRFSGISTGTERLFYTGEMPDFPGMGYPLVPGYETVGEVVAAGILASRSVGDWVFVPGANCYRDARGLFGGAASLLVTNARRVIPIDAALGPNGVMFSLAATAHHAVRSVSSGLPELIVGHGALGRLIARIVVALGGAPRVWEVDEARRAGATGYEVVDPARDSSRRFRSLIDASGHGAALDRWITALAPQGEIVLAGFYTQPLQFNFVPAFLRESRIRVAAQWSPDDLTAVRGLVERGQLSLTGIVTDLQPAEDAATAYPRAFGDPACLKMVLDWRHVQ